MELGTWIRDALRRHGKTQAALSRHLGFAHPSTVNFILTGKRRVQVPELALIAEFLGEDPPNFPVTAMSTLTKSAGSVPVKGVAMEGVWREGQANTSKRVSAVIGSGYPVEVQYALLIDEPGGRSKSPANM